MHRVELKERSDGIVGILSSDVPNAPCGVESYLLQFFISLLTSVPNAPCGVERWKELANKLAFSVFLMHRVELKAETMSMSGWEKIGS